MNWDWDKLQEKRQRQGGQQPSRDHRDNEPPGDGGNFGSGPDFGQFGDVFKQFRNIRFPVFKLIILFGLLIWLGSGIFIVAPDEVGVVLRFGKYTGRTVPPGPHYRWPFPIEESITPKVSHVQRVEIGFRTVRNNRDGQPAVRQVLEEAAMLTGDENIVNVQFIVQYQIKDPVDFLFNVDLQIPAGRVG